MNAIYCLFLDLDNKSCHEAETWVRRFSEFMAQPPFERLIEIRAVDEMLSDQLCQVMGLDDQCSQAMDEDELCDLADDTIEVLLKAEMESQAYKPNGPPKLVVICQPDNVLTKNIMAVKPHARWGCVIGSCVSVVYRHEPTVIWHEMFHLFGAKDCYPEECPDETALPLCGQWNCIMQYAASLAKVGDPPFLCDGNVQLVRCLPSNQTSAE